MKALVVFGILVLLGFIGVYMLTNQNKPLTPPPAGGPTVPENARITAKFATIRTAKGNIEVELYASEAAKTVTNFATLAKRGFYNNLTFHRVESWVIQGGDPEGTGVGGYSIYGPTFEDELNPETPSYKAGYLEGILAMANKGPNTNGSQFFILTRATPLQHAYAIFGKVTNGMNVAKSIQKGDKILGINIQ